jgi:4'-phosphopantetheinyl transferase EntD
MNLQLLYPVPISAVLRRIPDQELPLHPAEEVAVARAVPKRRREFSTGRACAKQALAELGIVIDSLPRLDEGPPAWPGGVVGAITHSNAWGAAVVARSIDALGVGIDIELAGRMSERAARYALSQTELDACARHPLGPAAAWILMFSAKESIYKCLYPTVRRFIGFMEAEITLHDDGTFEARLVDKLMAELPAKSRRFGRFQLLDDHVVTAFTMVGGE